MRVGFDAVARELTFGPDDGQPLLVLRSSRLFVHVYADAGHLGCEIEGDAIDLYFSNVDGEPPYLPVLVQVEPGHWRLTFIPAGSS